MNVTLDFPSITQAAYLFVWCASEELGNRFSEMAVHAGYEPHLLTTGTVRLFVVRSVDGLPERVATVFTLEEQRQIKVLLGESEKPDLAKFGAVATLENFCQHVSSRWLMELLAENRLKSLMQPIVYSSSKEVYAYEFLLRGLTREGEEIPAPVMFKAGGDAGASYLLDLAAGEHALQSAEHYGVRQKVFVNVLPSTLTGEDGLDGWLEVMKTASPSLLRNLVFEVVESERFVSHEQLITLKKNLNNQGIEVALDDFGTGFNNLSTLTEVQPDYIKLDKSLVWGLKHDARKWNMVANIVDAAKQAHVKVIGEGVEDMETAAALVSIGVDFLQGYYFGYPKEGPLGFDGF